MGQVLENAETGKKRGGCGMIPEQKQANGAVMEECGRDANPYVPGTLEYGAWEVSWVAAKMCQAIKDGHQAREEGKNLTDCPNDLEEVFQKVWRLGWSGKVRKRW